MKLPGNLFHPGGPDLSRAFRTKDRPLESNLPNLSLPKRFMATLIAAICFCAGIAMILFGIRNGMWLLVLLGPFSVSYGIAWVWVAHEGRLPGERLRWIPWNRG